MDDTERWEDLGGQPTTTQPVSEHGQQFLDALTPYARSVFHPTATAGTSLKKAISAGWTPKDLAKECSRDLHSAQNAGAIINHRLEQCSRIARDRGPEKFAQPLMWCGGCSDPSARWRLDTDAAVRCDCWTDPKGSG